MENSAVPTNSADHSVVGNQVTQTKQANRAALADSSPILRAGASTAFWTAVPAHILVPLVLIPRIRPLLAPRVSPSRLRSRLSPTMVNQKRCVIFDLIPNHSCLYIDIYRIIFPYVITNTIPQSKIRRAIVHSSGINTYFDIQVFRLIVNNAKAS